MVYLCTDYEHASLPADKPDIHLADLLSIVSPTVER